MDKIAKFSKLLISVSIFLFSISALIFVLKFSTAPALAVETSQNSQPNHVFTQTDNGALKHWIWDKSKSEYRYIKYIKKQ